jgi:hypothetical protein
VNSWLEQQADALAAVAGVDRASLTLASADVDALLDLARIAAHESGDRRNAPLLCYLIGRAQAAGATVDELAGAVRGSTS